MFEETFSLQKVAQMPVEDRQTGISPKKTSRWLRNTWKDLQHHYLLEKCNSKPQWDITSHWSEWPSSKSLQTINAGEGVDKREGTLLHCWECKLIQPLWKTVWRFLKKPEIKPPYDPAILLIGIYPEETKTKRDMCIPLFIAALFTIARTWKQPRCLKVKNCGTYTQWNITHP